MALQRWLVAHATMGIICCVWLFSASFLSESALHAAESQIQIIDFTAKSCVPCQSMQPVIVKLAKEGWHIRQVDVEQERQLIEPFQVKSVPTLVILRDGKEVDRVIGALGYEKLKARLQKASGKSSTDTLKDDFLAMVAPSNAGGPSSPSTAAGAAHAAAPSTVRGQSPMAFPMLSSASGTINNVASGAAALAAFESAQPSAATVSAPASAPAFASAQPASSPATQGNPATLGNSTAAATQFPDFNAGPSTAPVLSQPAAALTRQPAVQPAAYSMQPLSDAPSLGLAHASPSRQPAMSPQAAIARAQAATVRIRVDEPGAISFGTGTVINMHGGQALVLTCGHIFRDMTPQAKLSVDVYQNGQPINLPAQVVTFNAKEADIGLIEFRAPFAIDPVPVAPMAAAPQIGQPAFSFGCDKGADPTRRDTQIKRLNRYLGAANVEIHGAPVVGRSGGGLFDSEGRLIGICNAADEEDDEGIYAALPVIHQQLAALQLDNLTQPAPSASEVAAQLQCVIRDAQGRQSTLVIDRPSEALLAILRQSATK